uniref:Putative ovule protein n=1 Tax=Solanum chacoense TaxID=4108 RepID=A0A0V0IDQ7_SOLCH
MKKLLDIILETSRTELLPILQLRNLVEQKALLPHSKLDSNCSLLHLFALSEQKNQIRDTYNQLLLVSSSTIYV